MDNNEKKENVGRTCSTCAYHWPKHAAAAVMIPPPAAASKIVTQSQPQQPVMMGCLFICQNVMCPCLGMAVAAWKDNCDSWTDPHELAGVSTATITDEERDIPHEST